MKRPIQEFPAEKIARVCADIDKALDEGAEPLAAFDADGTLWPMDLGLEFLNYKIANNLVKSMTPEEIDEARNKVRWEENKHDYLLWVARCSAGYDLETIQNMVKDSLVELEKRVGNPFFFESQKQIIAHLLKRNVETHIVTGSPWWAVNPAAELIGLKDQVLGVNMEVVDGLITTTPKGHLTYDDGKVTALLEKTGGRKPFFAAGNSHGDLALLELSTHVHLVIGSAEPGYYTYEQERDMLQKAQDRSWHHHDYLIKKS